jgi:hypothetical protein
MAEASELSAAKPGKPKKGCGCFVKSLAALFLFVLLGIALGPMTSGTKAASVVSQVREIGEAMSAYAADHHGVYPTGGSSTEIFQKLIDEKYISDPAVFYYYGLREKVPPSSTRLKPENVAFDVTSGVDGSSSDLLPVVFLTGFKVGYSAGAPAIPLRNTRDIRSSGIAVYYKNFIAAYKGNDMKPDGVVDEFIPNEFSDPGKIYQQLTPNGPLSP